nr:LINE-1 reverse transcriptase isogeny [Ipomoea batatas]
MNDALDGWDEEILHDLFLERDMSLILKVPISLSKGRDIMYWEGEVDGQYSVKSAYRLLVGEKEGVWEAYGWHWDVGDENAVRENGNMLGIGWVLRNYMGVVVAAGAVGRRGAVLAREAKALAIREALSWLKGRDYDNVIVETDAQQIIHHLYSHNSSPYGLLLHDITVLLSFFANIRLCFVRRSANTVAHLLARNAALSEEKDGEIGELQGDAESVDGHDENAVRMDEWHGIEHPHEAVHQCRMWPAVSGWRAEKQFGKAHIQTGWRIIGRSGVHKKQSGLVSNWYGEARLDWFFSFTKNQSGLVLPNADLASWCSEGVGQTGFAENQFGNHSRLVGEISRPDWFHKKPVWTGFQTGWRNQSGLVSLH